MVETNNCHCFRTNLPPPFQSDFCLVCYFCYDCYFSICFFFGSRKVFNPKVHCKNLIKRYESGNYIDDVTAFVKPTVAFDLPKAAKSVISQYSFLNEFDSQDKNFLNMAGILLGKRVPKKSAALLQKVDKPLKFLFDSINISREASEISTDEIRVFRKKKE